MRIERKMLVLSIIILVFVGCNPFKKGEDSMLCRIIVDKRGETIKVGEEVELSLTEKTEENSIIWSSSDYDRPALVKREKAMFRGDLFETLGLLSQGDSAIVKINIDSMEMKMGQPRPKFTKGKYLIYTLKINNVVHKEELNDKLYAVKVNEFLKARLEQLRIKEPSKIRNYMAAQHLNAGVTGSGLNYIITQKGTGPAPVPGDTMEVNYTGMLLSGKVFDSTYPDMAKKAGVFHDLYNPYKMTYGMYGTTPGLNEAIMMMPKGAKIKVIIPSALAYGKKGDDTRIQAYTPLVYEIEMVNIIHPHKKSK